MTTIDNTTTEGEKRKRSLNFTRWMTVKNHDKAGRGKFGSIKAPTGARKKEVRDGWETWGKLGTKTRRKDRSIKETSQGQGEIKQIKLSWGPDKPEKNR